MFSNPETRAKDVVLADDYERRAEAVELEDRKPALRTARTEFKSAALRRLSAA